MIGLESPDEGSTLELLDEARAGDGEAWGRLFRRYHDPLLLYARTRLGRELRRHLQSEDVFQSVVTDALTALRGFEYRGAGSLNRFLRTMVLNKIRDRADHYGARKRAGEVTLTDALLDAAHEDTPTYEDPETYGRLERCLSALPEEMREVLVLRKVEGLSSKEVATELGKSDAAVRKLYSRSLARLTALMAAGDGREERS